MRVSFETRELMIVEFDDIRECTCMLQLLEDASGGAHDKSLAETLFKFSSEKTALEEYEEWSQWVKPELENTFRGHIELVRDALKDQPDMVKIESEHYEVWYGALNLARIALDSQYRFAAVDNADEVKGWLGEKQLAFMRYRVALALQSGILEAMDCYD